MLSLERWNRYGVWFTCLYQGALKSPGITITLHQEEQNTTKTHIVSHCWLEGSLLLSIRKKKNRLFQTRHSLCFVWGPNSSPQICRLAQRHDGKYGILVMSVHLSICLSVYLPSYLWRLSWFIINYCCYCHVQQRCTSTWTSIGMYCFVFHVICPGFRTLWIPFANKQYRYSLASILARASKSLPGGHKGNKAF